MIRIILVGAIILGVLIACVGVLCGALTMMFSLNSKVLSDMRLGQALLFPSLVHLMCYFSLWFAHRRNPLRM